MIAKKLKLLLCVLTLSLMFLGIGVTAQSNSIIPDDTCAPPCWMGLIPGESQSEDVKQLVESLSLDDVEVYGVFNEETRNLITGIYEFTFLERETSRVIVEIQIRDSIVYSIILYPTVPERFPDTTLPDEYITMQQALNRLGQPERVHAYRVGIMYGDEFYLSHIYLQTRLRIEYSYNPSSMRPGCQLQTIEADMVVSKLTYYSIEAAQAQSLYPGSDNLQEVLTALHLGENLVSQDVWYEVINDEHEGYCSSIPFENNNPTTAPIVFVEPDNPHSLFAGDTCAPPCWFDLTPGESTTEDVAAFLQNTQDIFRDRRIHNDSVFDEETGLMISGAYFREWLFYQPFGRVRPFFENSLSISYGILDNIQIVPDRAVLLYEVLQNQGTPDYISLDWLEFSGAHLRFGYFDMRLQVTFHSIGFGCNLSRMSNNFWVDRIYYYAPLSKQELQAYMGYGIEVPMDTWNQWINGDVTGRCRTGWNDLLNQ